ncbi:MAG: B12-binding domain-containing radical SAM protein [Planctomycetota bacterium]
MGTSSKLAAAAPQCAEAVAETPARSSREAVRAPSFSSVTPQRVLFTSVCRPIGPAYGDGPSVGYELLHGQVTRAQGMFSPRSVHLHFSLEYVAENLDAACVVLQYPSRGELIAELEKDYDYVGVSFLLALFHRMQDVVALVRKHAPTTRIVLGGYGTVLSDEVLEPYSDYICREEGVGFMRRLLGEPEISMPYKHPLIVSELRVFGAQVSTTGMVFAGLGCPNGCDFCCTSHFFGRRHIKLLPTGKDIYGVVERYLAIDPRMSLVILDEDFLLNRRRALEFRDEVIAGGKALSIFAFASVRALSKYTTEQLVEMGIDSLWIGYEGKRSGFKKQEGRPVEELFAELRAHGISILASMIVGMPHQDEAIVQQELDGLLALEPSLCQFLIYGPTPGTPFFERVTREGLLRKDLAADPLLYYRKCDGFTSMVDHPELSPARIEAQQRDCFRQDYARLGPSIYRSVEAWLRGYLTLRGSNNPVLRRKAASLAKDVRKAYPVFLAGRLFGPNRAIRKKVGALQRAAHAELGQPTFAERLRSVAAVGLALWTSFSLKFQLGQHPRVVRHEYRMPAAVPKLARVWRQLRQLRQGVSLERTTQGAVWLRLRGELREMDAARLSERLRRALQRTRDSLVLDFKRLTQLEREAAQRLADALQDHRDRIRILVPSTLMAQGVAAAFAMFTLQHVPFGS